MADSMRDIKRRIKSVTSTKQITHAMQLVASAKLRNARMKADARRAYTNYVIETMHMISGALEKEEPSAFFKPNGCEKDLYIVVTSDKGLAGGFNSGLLKFTAEAMKQSKECAVMVSGAKGLDYFRRRNYEILGSYIGESDEASLGVANSIGKAAFSFCTFYEKKAFFQKCFTSCHAGCQRIVFCFFIRQKLKNCVYI